MEQKKKCIHTCPLRSPLCWVHGTIGCRQPSLHGVYSDVVPASLSVCACAVEPPVMAVEEGGSACLLVLPSDKPAARVEAVAVESLLADLINDPQAAANK